MDDFKLFLALAGVVGALLVSVVTATVTLYLDRRRSSLRHARENNLSYFQDIFLRIVSVKDAIQGFGDVWSRQYRPFEELNHDLYKILVARVAEFNRELSPSINPDVFLLPTKIETELNSIRETLNRAISQTDISSKFQMIGYTEDDEKVEMYKEVELEKFPDNISTDDVFRWIDVRRRPCLVGSDFCRPLIRSKMIAELELVASRIKKLAVE